jgi:hypothetical protein
MRPTPQRRAPTVAPLVTGEKSDLNPWQSLASYRPVKAKS